MLSPETRITSFVTGSSRAFFHKKARLEEHSSPRPRPTPTELEFEEPLIAGQDHTFHVPLFERQTPDDTRSARTAVRCAVAALGAQKNDLSQVGRLKHRIRGEEMQRATGTKPGPDASSECSTSIPLLSVGFHRSNRAPGFPCSSSRAAPSLHRTIVDALPRNSREDKADLERRLQNSGARIREENFLGKP